MCGSGPSYLASCHTTLIISSGGMNDLMKTVKSLKESGLLTKGVSETIKNETKERKREFFSMLSGTLGTGLLGNLLAGKCTIRAAKALLQQDF